MKKRRRSRRSRRNRTRMLRAKQTRSKQTNSKMERRQKVLEQLDKSLVNRFLCVKAVDCPRDCQNKLYIYIYIR